MNYNYFLELLNIDCLVENFRNLYILRGYLFQSKLVRAPTPYPKELKAHARHARNYALKKQGSKDSEGNEVTTEDTQVSYF